MNRKRHNYVPPQGVIQDLGVNQLKTRFKTFFFHFFEKKERRKKSKHAEKSFECLHHLKSVRNTQQMFIFGWPFEKHGLVGSGLKYGVMTQTRRYIEDMNNWG